MDNEHKIETPSQQEARLHVEFMRKSLELMMNGFALVAALAWNDAIQTAFSKIFGQESTVAAKFLYAVFITAIIVSLGRRLSRLEKKLPKS